MCFCLEGADNDFDVLEMQLKPDSQVAAAWDVKLLGGVTSLHGKGLVNGNAVGFKAIPYFAWENRGIYKMSLLLIEDPAKVSKQKEEEQKDFNTQG